MPRYCYVEGCGSYYGSRTTSIKYKRRRRTDFDANTSDGINQEEYIAKEEDKTKKGKVHMYRLPKNATEEVRNAWLQNIPQRPENPFNITKDFICHLHFDVEDILTDYKITINGEPVSIPTEYVRLRKHAVPTRFPDISTNNLKRSARVNQRTGRKKRRISGCLKNRQNVARIPTALEQQREDEYYFDDPKFQTEYYCAFCLETWLSRIVSSSHLQRRAEVFQKFLRLLGRYANTKVNVELEKIFDGFGETMKSVKELKVPVQKLKCESLTICTNCLNQTSKICGVLEKLEILRMKTNAEILQFTELLRTTEEEASDHQDKIRNAVGERKLQALVACHKAVRCAGKRLLVPKIRLIPVDAPDGPIEPAMVSESFPFSVEAKEIRNKCNNNNASKITFETVLSTPYLEITNNVFCGNAQIRQLVGGVKPWQVVSCPFCSKTFQSNDKMENHRKAYHGLNTVRILKTTNVTDAKQVEDEDLNCSSMPGTPMTVEDSDNVDDMMEVDKRQNFDVDSNPVGQGHGYQSGEKFTGNGYLSKIIQTQSAVPTLILNDDLLRKENSETLSRLPSKPDSVGQSEINKRITEAATVAAAPLEFPANSSYTPEDQILLEPKLEVEPEEPPKKIPFMSAEYIGKYKILCKLKNLQTGKTVFGVVAKSKSASSSSQVTYSETLHPKVISVQGEPEKKKMKRNMSTSSQFPGPPYICPLENCIMSFSKLKSVKAHYQRHLRKIAKQQKDIENGIFKPTKGEKEKSVTKPLPKKQKKLQRLACNEPYQCQIEKCGYGFKHQQSLDYHMKIYHSEFQCHFCSERIYNLIKLIEHEHQHVQADAPTLSSSIANEVNPTGKTNTTQTNEGACPCPRCEFVCFFSRKSYVQKSLVHHYSRVHLNIREGLSIPKRRHGLKCTDCNRLFTNSGKYARHKQTFHGETVDLPFKCPQCDKRFLKAKGLHHHTKGSHSTKDRRRQVITCNVCFALYTQRRHYNNHMKQHYSNVIDEFGKKLKKSTRENYSFSCDDCGRRFWNEGYLWNHKMDFHSKSNNSEIERQLICSVCGEAFQTSAKMRAHMRAHAITQVQNGENGVVCDLCGKKFVNIGRLRMHIKMTHDRDKESKRGPAICEICGKTYPSKLYLYNHKRRMHPVDASGNPVEKPLPICSICGTKYPNMGLLRKHFNSKHIVTTTTEQTLPSLLLE